MRTDNSSGLMYRAVAPSLCDSLKYTRSWKIPIKTTTRDLVTTTSRIAIPALTYWIFCESLPFENNRSSATKSSTTVDPLESFPSRFGTFSTPNSFSMGKTLLQLGVGYNITSLTSFFFFCFFPVTAFIGLCLKAPPRSLYDDSLFYQAVHTLYAFRLPPSVSFIALEKDVSNMQQPLWFYGIWRITVCSCRQNLLNPCPFPS